MMSLRLLGPVLLIAMLAVSPATTVRAELLRDLASFSGVRTNALVGYGLVVGLDGTGDQTMQTPFTTQSLRSMLSQMGITIPPGANMQLRNIAAVMVTAELQPFSRPGQRLDVVVSSIGNARSVRGGTLLMTPLKGADGAVYAMAQGNLLVGGVGAEAGGSSVQINQQAGGRISDGATVERAVLVHLGTAGGALELELRKADFGTVERTVNAINREFGRPVAAAVDSRVVRLQGPSDADARVSFMARVQRVDVTPEPARAKVVINSRTGSVVLNGQVRLHSAAVAHGNLSVVIDTAFGVSQPAPFSQGETVVVPDSDIAIEQQPGTLHVVEGADLMEVVEALNALGANPLDLMSILEALKAAGSLRAELEII